MNALQRLQAEWDATPPIPAPPSTALLHPLARPSWRGVVLGAGLLWSAGLVIYGAVLAVAAFRIGMLP